MIRLTKIFTTIAGIIAGFVFIFKISAVHINAVQPQTQIVYFYLSACDGCSEAQQYLSDVTELLSQNGQNSNIDIRMINVFESGGYSLMLNFFEEYSVPKDEQSCPIVFVGSHYYSGEESIKSHLLDAAKNPGITKYQLPTGQTDQTDELAASIFRTLKPMNVFLTGLINGFNPCSLSMILFFFSLLGVRRLNVLKAGIGFCIGKFAMYLLLGFVSYGILDAIDMNQYKLVTKLIALIVSLTIASLNLWDYFAAKNENYDKIKVQLPHGLRKFNHKLIRYVTKLETEKILLPVCVLLGVFVSLGEFLCTGQVYLATILYMIKDQTEKTLGTTAVVYFVLYCVAIISPLLVITILINKGKELMEVSENIREKLPVIKLVNALFFIVFAGVWVFLL